MVNEIVIIDDEEEILSVEQEDNSRPDESLLKLESLKFLRVLLVESDDCTRSIITALLRKSGYKVVAVADGLKAWETLKSGTSQNIDLVLAEVELPSAISGFSLLTMIMEDDICRNIPVIMMSSYDAVSLVFKCMLTGAADFLVKPVRKNELRNLWQHVWRRHSVNNVGQGNQDENTSQHKTQAIDETSSTKHSTPRLKSPQENKEYIERGSDEQSSCTKPVMEEEDTNMQNWNVTFTNSITSSKEKEFVEVDNVSLKDGDDVQDNSIRFLSEAAPCNKSNYSTALIPEEHDARIMKQDNDTTPQATREGSDIQIGVVYDNDEQSKPCREVMDLIGSFDDHLCPYNTCSQEVPPKNLSVYFDSNGTKLNCSSKPQLELSLRRSEFIDNDIQGAGEIQTLKHSNVSAFSRYNQHTVPSSVCTESKESTSTSRKHQSDQSLNHTDELPRHRVISVPIPARSTWVDGLSSGYGVVWPQLFYAPVGPLPLQSSNSVAQQDAVFHVYSSDQSIPQNNDYQQSNCKSFGASMDEQRHNVETVDDSRCFTGATAQNVTSSLCYSSSSNINSDGCGSVCDGSNGNEAPVTITGGTTGCRGGVGVLMSDGLRGMDSHSLNQREAALTKFRLKRKDRCFDKKVRYQSRKKLAEQRPRVKGQFVRQIPV